MLLNFEWSIKNENVGIFYYFNLRLGSKIQTGKTGCRAEFDFNIEFVGFRDPV